MSVAGQAEETVPAKAGRKHSLQREVLGGGQDLQGWLPAEGGGGPVDRDLVSEAREFAQCPGTEGCRSGLLQTCLFERSPGQLGRRPRGKEARVSAMVPGNGDLVQEMEMKGGEMEDGSGWGRRLDATKN